MLLLTIGEPAGIVNILSVYKLYTERRFLCYDKRMNRHQSSIRESDRIEAELRQLILILELKPGLSISEASLMKQYGWGRTPLREAIQRLAEQSLLEIVPRHGAVVTALSVFDFAEMMDAMQMVIGPATVLACQRISSEELAQLEKIAYASEAAAQEENFVDVARLDYEFHHILAEATGNRHLCRYLLHLHQVATRFNFATWKRDRSAAASIDEHRQIVSIMQNRDVDEARLAMQHHIENARKRIVGTRSRADLDM
jgi:GntR family transcriptional regulator, rspAB operon transcriptional repressor